jgi:uncharacterized protein
MIMAGMESLEKVGHWLVIVGALNWGIVGATGLVGSPLNVISMILGSIPVLENLVYLLVGLGALLMLKKQFAK